MRIVATKAVRRGAPVLYADLDDGTVRLAAGPDDDGRTRKIDPGELGDPEVEWVVKALRPGFWADRAAPGDPFGRHHDHDHETGLHDFDRIKAQIDRTGCQIIQVLTTAEDREDDPTAMDFSYTVGLRYAFDDHPDLIVSAMQPSTARGTLLSVVDLVRDGRRLAHGDRVDNIFTDGTPALLVEVSEEARKDTMTTTDRFYARSPFTALQVVYGDAEGRWPWDEGSLAAGQELFGEPPPTP